MSPRPPRKVKAVDTPVALSPEEIAFVKSLVIFEDAQLIALNKPSGLSSQGGRAQVHTLDEMLWAFAKREKPRPRLIHRLDRDTSGVILTAKTKPAAGFLGKAIMARKVKKTYLAIVAPGPIEPPSGEITVALRREELGREAYIRACADDHPDAEPAHTLYRTLVSTPEAVLVELNPVTGRMHQLRVHLAHLGRPIAGDPRYGGALRLGDHAVPRLMLHARALTFPHPEGGTTTIEAPPPDDFQGLTEALGLV